jgi:hypothetical protein
VEIPRCLSNEESMGARLPTSKGGYLFIEKAKNKFKS